VRFGAKARSKARAGAAALWAAAALAVVAGEDATVTDEDIETFAKIYVGIEREAQRYEQAISHAESAEEAQEIQARLQADTLAVLEKHGWSQQKYARITRALNADPKLAAEALRRIEEER